MKVITIAGSGRTGSTLLSLLLSQNNDTFNLGQMRDFWRSFVLNEHCSCGERLSTCAILSRAVTIVFGKQPTEKLQAMHAGMISFVAEASAFPNWSDRADLHNLSARHTKYLGGLLEFLKCLSELTGSSAFIDSSKTPEIALSFCLLDQLDTRVINLVRDPRAVALSWEKRHDINVALRMSRIWAQRQARLSSWSTTLGSKFALVKYEDFVKRPRTFVKELLDWAALDSSVDQFDTDYHAYVSWARQHLFPPTNEKVLLEKRTSVDIAEASDWKYHSNDALLRSVIELTGPIMHQLGYTFEVAVKQ